MSLDNEETITRLQSTTVRSAIVLIVINVLTLIATFTGRTFDIDAIKSALDTWLPIAIQIASAWFGWKAYTGRVNATKQIEK